MGSLTKAAVVGLAAQFNASPPRFLMQWVTAPRTARISDADLVRVINASGFWSRRVDVAAGRWKQSTVRRLIAMRDDMDLCSELAALEYRMGDAEVVVAAKFFTLSNLGQDVSQRDRSVGGIRDAFAQLQMGAHAEGVDIDDEYRDWLRNFQAHDLYWVAEWKREAATVAGIDQLRAAAAKAVR